MFVDLKVLIWKIIEESSLNGEIMRADLTCCFLFLYAHFALSEFLCILEKAQSLLILLNFEKIHCVICHLIFIYGIFKRNLASVTVCKKRLIQSDYHKIK